MLGVIADRFALRSSLPRKAHQMSWMKNTGIRSPQMQLQQQKRGISFVNRLEDFWLEYQKQRLLLRGAMVKKRKLTISYVPTSFPFSIRFRYITGADMLTIPYTLSDLAGHSSFFFLALSYLENEFFYLRIYAMSGLTLSMVFQYYRERPLWIPIRWNSLFWTINLFMVLIILKDEADAASIPEEQQQIYETVFRQKGMKPVDFLHLMTKARRNCWKSGESIVIQGKEHDHLHLVLSGILTVKHDFSEEPNCYDIIGKVKPNQFIGEMSFLRYESKSGGPNKSSQKFNDLMASAVNLISSDSDSRNNNNNNNSSNNNNSNIISNNNNSSLIRSNYSSGYNGNNNNSHTSDKSSINVRGEKATSTVFCDDDCVVYSWSFDDLKELINLNGNIGLVFERSIAADLNNKMMAALKEPSFRYKRSLSGVLSKGSISETEKRSLENARADNNISISEHNNLVEQLGWSVTEFEVGKKKGNLDESEYERFLETYMGLLSRELTDKKKISSKARDALRLHRKVNQIRFEDHIRLLKRLGWTGDEYEVNYCTLCCGGLALISKS